MHSKTIVLTGLLIVMTMTLAACAQPIQLLGTDATVGEEQVEESGEEATLYVGPTLMECTGAGPQTCMLIRSDPDAEYTFFYSQIEGFDYVPGYEYELKVEVATVPNPPADGSSLRYSLIEVVAATEVGPTLEGTPWQMISVVDGEGQTAAALPEVEITALFEDGTLSGNDGCNSYSGSYSVDGTSLEISPAMATTLMACPEPIMQQAGAYQAALAATAGYQIVNYQLQLLDENGRAAVTFEVHEPIGLTGTLWSAIGYNNGKEAVVSLIIDTEITATFGEDGIVSGSAGCNTYSGAYEADETNIKIGPTAGTMRLCPEPEEIMEQEFLYLAALEMAEVYTIDGDRLQLRTSDGALVADYRAADPAEDDAAETADSDTADESAPATPTDSGSAENMTAPMLEGTPWQMLAVVDDAGQLADALPEVEVTALFENDTVVGNDGCNNYFGSYTLDGTSLEISPNLGMTAMACPDPIMQQSSAYLTALAATASYSIEDAQLQLLDEAGGTLVVYALRESAELVGTPWSATGYNNGRGGVTSLVIGTEITALFDAEGTLSGSAGCNNYSAGYEVDGETIAIGPAASTRMMCGEPEGVMAQESEYLAALGMANVYRIDGDILELRTDEGALVASYTRAVEGADTATTEETSSDGSSATMMADDLTNTLANMSYQSAYTADGTAPLSNGEYSEAAAPGSATKTTVRLSQHMATGELNGQLAAAVVLVTDPGGSGTFYDLAVVMEQGGEPVNVATTNLGDRVQINDVTIEDNQIVVDMVQAGPDDPLCCPTQQVINSYTLDGDQLAEQSSEVVGNVASNDTGANATATVAPTEAATIVGIEWHWFEYEGNEGQSIFVQDPSRYTLLLNPDGTAAVRADCNNGNGTYELDGDSLTVTILAVTRALCPAQSLSDDYLRLLGEVVTYVEDGEGLILKLADDGGQMSLQREAATIEKAHDPAAIFPQDALSLDPGALATSYHWQVLPPTPYDASMPPVPAGTPAHVVLTFDYMPAPEALSDGGPVIVVYPIQDYSDLWQEAGNDTISMTVVALQELLAGQPVPAAPMPILPPPGGVNDLVVQSAYLNFGGGTGVRFVGRVAQDASPIINGQLAYYYQGLTDDGRYYVSVRWPVTTTDVPNDVTEFSAENLAAIEKNATIYLEQATESLNTLDASDWVPNLDELDALIESFTLDVPGS